MTFSLRVDLESQKGIKKGLPKLLNLLKKYNIKASFYLTMGGESNILEIIKHRKKLRGERQIKVFSKLEILRMILFPLDFVSKNRKILQKILNEGNELGIHGWKHRRWTRNLENIDIKREIENAMRKYEKIFKTSPKSFCSPAFRINEKVIEFLNEKGFEVISDLNGTKPFRVKNTNIINVPITIPGENNSPIIESLAEKGFSDEQILEHLKKEIQSKDPAILYIHGMYECIQKEKLLDNLFSWIKKNKIKTQTIYEASKNENLADK